MLPSLTNYLLVPKVYNFFENQGGVLKILGISYSPCVSGDDLINDGAESLKRLRDKIVHKSDEKAPSFLLVLTAVGAAYKREDGVCVAPINMLKP